MDKELATIIYEDAGYEYGDIDFLTEMVMDSVVPGICRKCHGIYSAEPDARENWCGDCRSNTVVGLLVLEGLI